MAPFWSSRQSSRWSSEASSMENVDTSRTYPIPDIDRRLEAVAATMRNHPFRTAMGSSLK